MGKTSILFMVSLCTAAGVTLAAGCGSSSNKAAPVVVDGGEDSGDDGSTDLIVHFGRGFGLDEPAFDGLEVERLDGAAPVLKDALAYLDCRVVSRYLAGDHELFIGRVVAGATHGDGKPIIHVRKSGLHY